jgi:hypothetical protein
MKTVKTSQKQRKQSKIKDPLSERELIDFEQSFLEQFHVVYGKVVTQLSNENSLTPGSHLAARYALFLVAEDFKPLLAEHRSELDRLRVIL